MTLHIIAKIILKGNTCWGIASSSASVEPAIRAQNKRIKVTRIWIIVEIAI